MPSYLEWAFTEVPGALVAKPAGEIDIMTSQQFIADLAAAAEAAKDREHVVLDLTGVSFLGARGVDAIERSSRALHATGQTLMVVAEPGSIVRRVLEIAPPSPPVPIMSTVDTAVAEVRRREQAAGGES